MKIALHQSKDSFFANWKNYCELHNIPHKVVDCYATDIMAQLADCGALMWHHNHANPRDVLFARQLLVSLEIAGKKVFPDHFSNWHFDDKLGQKYLFEATQIAHVPTYVFFDEDKALKWALSTSYPKVFKLRRGAGSRNVWLINSKKEATKVIKKAFGVGFRQYDAWGGIDENIRKFKLGKGSLKDIIKSMVHTFYPIQLERSQGRERGYIYFQDFVPENAFDIRVIVMGDKAFAIKRHARGNDFRASGSGIIEYDKELFDISLIAASFENAEKIKAYCAAFDYIFLNGKPLVLEVSYAFNKNVYYDCQGYWTKDLVWHEGSFNPYGWMIDDLVNQQEAVLPN